MPENETDFFEIAHKLTRAHSALAGKVYLQDAELGAARDVVRALVDQVIYMAEIIHRTYHDPDERWTECRSAHCGSAAELLASLSVGHGIDMRIASIRRERDELQAEVDELKEAFDNLKIGLPE